MNKYIKLLFLLCTSVMLAQEQVNSKTFSKNLAGTSITNEVAQKATTNYGGDMNLSIPLVTVKSKTMTFPVELNYTSGITVDQQSGAVGLGWALPFGSIVRDFGAFEPDYTSVNSELNMKSNSEDGEDGWIANTNLNPSYNTVDPIYELTCEVPLGVAYHVPDEYHVSVPGKFSNTFYNGSYETHDWTFQEYSPYRIEDSQKIFEVSQEFSRINEINLGDTNFGNRADKAYFDKSGSYAAAIGLPSFVEDASIWKPIPSGESFNPSIDQRIVKYRDFESFTITDDQGVQYIFGRPLRGQKYYISEDPYWSTITQDISEIDHSQLTKGNFWKIDYIAEWLLTEIRNPDFVDVNGNGIADQGDLGDWIHIEYTEPTKREGYKLLAATNADTYMNVPSYREWSNYSQTDRASSLMRERAYVTKIITPVQEVDFTISQRFEVDHDYYSKPANTVGNNFETKHFYKDRKFTADGSSTDFDIHYPIETMKYDKITIKDKSRDYTLYNTRNAVQGTIVLNYADKGSEEELAVSNYLIRTNDDEARLINTPSNTHDFNISEYYTHNGRGKTTLTGVTFYSGLDKETDKQQFIFEYANNPSYSEIHKRAIVRKNFFPSLRQSGWRDSAFPPQTINTIDYITQEGTLLNDISPYDFLLDIPYTESYHTLDVPTGYKEAYLSNPNVLPVGTVSSVENIFHRLYPVKDEVNFAIRPNGLHNKSAWTLTKVNYPTGSSTTFEYELDNFNLATDKAQWNINEETIPLIEQYNELAIKRSKAQSVANDITVAGLKKTLTANFHINLKTNSGGIRLKKKIMDDGVHEPIEVSYEYGQGHYTALPSAYIQNYYSNFNSFIIREQKRHAWEKTNYPHDYPPEFITAETDYNLKMRHFAFSKVAIDKAKSTHYYDYIEEVFENGARKKKTYGGLSEDDDVVYETHKILYARDDISGSQVPKFVYAAEYNPFGDINLVKEEEFENLALTPYTTKTYTYDVDYTEEELNLESPHFPNESYGDGSGVYGGDFEIWTKTFGESIGGDFTEVFVYYSDYFTNHSFNIPPQTLFKWGNRHKYLTSETNKYRGSLSETNYEYGNYGYIDKEIKIVGDKTFITDINYAVDTYYGLTDLFTETNILSPKTEVTTYLNSISEANVLSSSFTTWDYSTSKPRPKEHYIFNTAETEHETGKFSFTPFNIDGSNPVEWQKIEKEHLAYNTDGNVTLEKTNRKYVKTIMGYNRSQIKASFIDIHGEFDATYSGFEDLVKPTEDIAIGSLPYPEYWYYQDTELVETNVSADINVGHFLDMGFCDNHSETIVEGDTVLVFLSVADNYDDDGTQIFGIGDHVVITGSYMDGDYPASISPLETTITNIVPMVGDAVKFCFEDILPSAYPVHWDSIIEITIHKQEFKSNSYPSTAYKRTGDYSYKLPSKENPSDASRKTPIRPIKPPVNSLADYPVICSLATETYPESCYTYYQASVWVKHDYDIPRVEAGHGIDLPFGTEEPSCDPVFQDNIQMSYERGTVTESMELDELPVKIIYKIYDADRTFLIDEGTYYLEGINTKWKQYTIDIPLFKGGENNQLDVYIESDVIDTNSFDYKKSVFVDDLLIYPKAAKYTYMSVDKFTNPTHTVNNDDVVIAQRSDEWGRKSRTWNAFGQQTSLYAYEVGKTAYHDNHVTETIWTAPSKYYQTRNYTDGDGKLLQSVVSDPNTNKRIVNTSNAYDAMGWLSKTYKPYSQKGCRFTAKYDANFVDKVEDLYDSEHAFNSLGYKASLEKFTQQTIQPRENDETEFAANSTMYRNTETIGGVYGIPTYEVNSLLVLEVTDPGGNIAKTYTDAFGRIVIKESALGPNHIDNADGSISLIGEDLPSAKTYLLYDDLGRLIKTVDPDGKITEYYYNSIGQQIKTSSPDRGITEMRYDTYGQLRFSQSVKDKELIATPSIIDQFKYIKYDAWGRITTSGMMREMSSSPLTNGLGEVYTPAVLFDDVNYINNQAFPEEGIMFNQVNHNTLFDGTRANFDSESLLSTTVYSNHVLNADYQFIPENTDKETFTYRLDGQISSKTYDYEEFSEPHTFTYTYNAMGIPVEKAYKHPFNDAYDFRWKHTYDNFGRIVSAKSGNDTEMVENNRNYYDALGKLYKVGLGRAEGVFSPHIDYTIYKQNIRNELVSKMSNHFRLGLAYDKSGLIQKQYWSTEYFDPTTPLTANLNVYEYYYDQSQRLIGADYKEQHFNYNPFDYFDELASTENNEFHCGLEIARYETYYGTVISDIENLNITDQYILQRKSAAVLAVQFVKDAYLTSQVNWQTLTQSEQEAFIQNIWQQGRANGINLKAYEMVKAYAENDQEHMQRIQNNNGQQFTASHYKYLTLLIDVAINYATSGTCKTNKKATIYGFLPDFDTSGATINYSKYDAAYWYHANGNTSLLHRKDDLGVLTAQDYLYGDASKNLLTQVSWTIGVEDPIIKGYNYDSLGNLTFDEQNNNTIAYNYFADLPIAINNDTGIKNYRYNAQGERSVKIALEGEEYYLDGIILDNTENVSMYKIDVGYVTTVGDGNLEFYYTITDWLGTTRVAFDETGTLTSARDHYPFGKRMPERILESDIEGERYQFTGHEFDDEVNYGYHGARYYNRDLGRYLSVDPLATKHPDVSPYVYVLNNPIRFIDPDGRTEDEPIGNRNRIGTYRVTIQSTLPSSRLDNTIYEDVTIDVVIGVQEFIKEDGTIGYIPYIRTDDTDANIFNGYELDISLEPEINNDGTTRTNGDFVFKIKLVGGDSSETNSETNSTETTDSEGISLKVEDVGYENKTENTTTNSQTNTKSKTFKGGTATGTIRGTVKIDDKGNLRAKLRQSSLKTFIKTLENNHPTDTEQKGREYFIKIRKRKSSGDY